MSYNILLVDDSEIIRAIITKTLKIANIPFKQLFEAGNGKEALDILDSNWIDLVFADINMPVMNGFEMLDKMAENSMLKAIPVVIISTEGSQTRMEQLIAKGVKAYLRKPFTPEQLKKVFDEIFCEGEKN